MSATTASSEPVKPDARVRTNAPVIAVTVIVMLVLVLGGVLGGVLPLISGINTANYNRQLANQTTQELQATKVTLEQQRDNIIEQYDAIKLFTDRYPNAADQESLYQDIQNSGLFATVEIGSISTEYPEVLAEGSYDEGTIITPDQIIINPSEEGELEEGQTTLVPGGADEGAASDTSGTDETSYPLATIPLSVEAEGDGSQAFMDNEGVSYVSSPYMGYYSFGGTTERPRLSMSIAIDSALDSLESTYFADQDSDFPTALRPNFDIPPYVEYEDPSSLEAGELIDIFPKATAPDAVPAPDEWASSNGFLPVAGTSRSAWLIDEIHNSPGRAILIRFVSASETSIAISGQQFIVRELPPLPESIFGDLNGDGVIEDEDGEVSAPVDETSPSPAPSTEPSAAPSSASSATPSPTASN